MAGGDGEFGQRVVLDATAQIASDAARLGQRSAEHNPARVDRGSDVDDDVGQVVKDTFG